MKRYFLNRDLFNNKKGTEFRKAHFLFEVYHSLNYLDEVDYKEEKDEKGYCKECGQ